MQGSGIGRGSDCKVYSFRLGHVGGARCWRGLGKIKLLRRPGSWLRLAEQDSSSASSLSRTSIKQRSTKDGAHCILLPFSPTLLGVAANVLSAERQLSGYVVHHVVCCLISDLIQQRRGSAILAKKAKLKTTIALWESRLSLQVVAYCRGLKNYQCYGHSPRFLIYICYTELA